ncbi:MAG: hypothetical protein JNL12_01195 [Planctomycetes bacterium]|nr:hypothetical protein [Planctomycetota bacterium]
MKTARLGAFVFASLLAAQQPPSDAELDAALLQYRALHLPEPPADAPLVLLASNVHGSDTAAGPALLPAFRLAKAADGTQPFLRGTQVDTSRHRVLAEAPFAEPPDAARLVMDEWHLEGDRHQDLAGGLQLWSRGHRDLARALVQRGAREQRLQHRVAALAAAHWYAQITESDLPLGDIERELRAAVAQLPDARPAVNGQPFVPPAPWAEILEQLACSAAAPSPKLLPEVVRVLGLVHSRRAGGIGARVDQRDAPFDAVVSQGFAIVPALIAHLDDARLTRATTSGFNNFQSYTRPLGELASDALQEIAGGVIPSEGLPAPRIDRAAAEAWWADASRQKEDAYLLERFLGDPDRPAHTGAMRILAARFPERLHLAMVELVLQHPERVSHPIIDAVADSPMREAKKVELLERLASTACEQRLQALRRLAGIDEERFCQRLLEVLANVPRQMPRSVWTSPDGRFGHLVVLTQRPEVWQAFVRAARKAPIGLRMEWLGPFAYTYLADRQRTERLACLASFLDDSEVYDVAASGQEGPHAAFTFRTLAMRDFAARQLAILLQFEQVGAPDWPEALWADLRTKVRQALRDAGIAAMQVPSDAPR